jgi:hypothetical protein
MLDASDVNSLFSDIFDFLATDEAGELTPTGGGDAIPFMHGLRSSDAIVKPNSPRVSMELIAWVKEPLSVGGVYTYNGHSWTVISLNYHKAGVQDVTYSYILNRHSS